MARIPDLQLDEGMPKKVFLRETIDKEVRLSYLERIQTTLPEEYGAVFPGKAAFDEWKLIAGMCRRPCND
jgi:MIF4G like